MDVCTHLLHVLGRRVIGTLLFLQRMDLRDQRSPLDLVLSVLELPGQRGDLGTQTLALLGRVRLSATRGPRALDRALL